jgi:hypothetical protein
MKIIVWRVLFVLLFIICCVNMLLLFHIALKKYDSMQNDSKRILESIQNVRNKIRDLETPQLMQESQLVRNHTLSYIKSCVNSSDASLDVSLRHWYRFMIDERSILCNFYKTYNILNKCVNKTHHDDRKLYSLLIKTYQLCSNI